MLDEPARPGEPQSDLTGLEHDRLDLTPATVTCHAAYARYAAPCPLPRNGARILTITIAVSDPTSGGRTVAQPMASSPS